MLAQQFGEAKRNLVCESLNINTILNARSNVLMPREICVLSVCGGRNDHFTKTVLDWLHRAKAISSIHFLLCGPSKCVDPQLCLQVKDDVAQRTRKKTPVGTEHAYGDFAPKIYLKRQTNMPSDAQWRILRPQIVVIGMHYLSERWSAKNCSDELLFPKHTTSDQGNTNDQSDNEVDYDSDHSDGSSGESENSGGASDADDESSNDSDEPLTRKRPRSILLVEKSRRPTLYRTEVYRKAMLIESLTLVATHRPKILFVQNIFEPSKQAERRRKDHAAWAQILEIMSAFGCECSYRVRPMGFEMCDDDDNRKDEFPVRDIWCNAVFLERIDNGFEQISRLHYEFALYNSRDTVTAIFAAFQWIFYDQQALKSSATTHHDLVEKFSIDGTELFKSVASTTKRKPIRQQKRKSVTIPVQLDFPIAYAKALAYYSVAQVTATLE